MSNESVAGSGVRDPNSQLGSLPGTIPAPILPAGTDAITYAHSRSSIQQSEVAALALLLAANFPMLIPPLHAGSDGVTAASASVANAKALMQTEQIKNDIITSMWDAYQKTVREIADRNKKDDIKRQQIEAENGGGPKSSSEYYAYLMSLSPGRLVIETGTDADVNLGMLINSTYNRWVEVPMDLAVQKAGHSLDYPSSAFVAGALIVNADMLNSTIGQQTDAMSKLSVNPVADALQAVGPATGLPGDYQAAAALVAALLNGGAIYKAAFESIAAASKKGKQPEDIDFAINYAASILKIVEHPVGDDRGVNKDRALQTKLMRLMLATMALNLLYRAAYGGMTGEEFGNLLHGNTDVDPKIKTLVESLVAAIHQFLPRSGRARDEMIANLMDYVDQKNSVESMLDTTRIYKSYFAATGDIQHKQWEALPS